MAYKRKARGRKSVGKKTGEGGGKELPNGSSGGGANSIITSHVRRPSLGRLHTVDVYTGNSARKTRNTGEPIIAKGSSRSFRGIIF